LQGLPRTGLPFEMPLTRPSAQEYLKSYILLELTLLNGHPGDACVYQRAFYSKAC
jgi:hypothetical protein